LTSAAACFIFAVARTIWKEPVRFRLLINSSAWSSVENAFAMKFETVFRREIRGDVAGDVDWDTRRATAERRGLASRDSAAAALAEFLPS
jgi:hypothetical protein